MRVMLLIKGDPQPGAAPSEELVGAMGSYNDELKEAGVLIDLAGLLPSAMGRRVRLAGRGRVMAVSVAMTVAMTVAVTMTVAAAVAAANGQVPPPHHHVQRSAHQFTSSS